MSRSATPAKNTAERNRREPGKLPLRVLAAELSLAQERERCALAQNPECDFALIASLQAETGETAQ